MSVVVRENLAKTEFVSLRNPSNLEGMRGLAMWSFVNLAAPLVNSVLPPASGVNTNGVKLYAVSLALNIVLTMYRVAVPLRMPAMLGGFVFLNLWLVICDFNATLTMGRTTPLLPLDFYILIYVLWFLQAAALAFYAPGYRQPYIRLLLGAVGLHAVVAILQFAHFGPILSLTASYSRHDITNWDNLGGTRVVGLTGWPETMSMWMITGAAYLMSPLLYGRLPGWRVAATTIVLLVAMLAQLRSLYPIIFTEGAIFMYLLVKRNRESTVAYISFASLLTLVGVALYLPVLSEKLKYGFSLNNNSLLYRLTIGWQQAFNILAHRPFWGIGHEQNFITLSSLVTTRWVAALPLDCGYLDLGAWGGYPAIAIMLVTGFLGIRGLVRYLKETKADPMVHRLVFVLLIQVGSILVSMLFNPTLFTVYFVQSAFVIGGLIMPTEAEYVKQKFRVAY